MAESRPPSAAQPGDGPLALERRNLHYANLNGVAAALAANMVQPFLGIYALRLGANNLQIGLMSSLPAFVSLVCAIPGGRVLDRTAHKQVAACILAIATRSFCLAYAMAPLFAGGLAPWFLVLAVAVANLPATLGQIALQALVAEGFAPRARARALASRSRLVALAGIVPLLFAGPLLDAIGYPLGNQIIFSAAFAIGIVEGLLLLRLVEIPVDAETAGGNRAAPGASDRRGATLREIIGQREFVQFEIASFILYLGWGMAGPLWTRYRVTVMGANNSWISLYSVCEALATVLALPFWARLGERRGSRNVLWWVAMGIAGNVWTLASVVDLRLGVITPLWCGVFNSGANLFILNSLLEVIPASRRATFLAYHTTVINLANFGGPMVAVAIMEWLGIREALFVSGLIRVAGGLLYRRFLPSSETTRAKPPAPAAQQ